MAWPTPQDFNEAVQNPRHNFADPELKAGRAQMNALGLPQANTGAFASVYRLHCTERDVALRCFLRGIEDRHKRYLHLSNFIRKAQSEYTVAFDFLLEGIHLRGNWFPVLKMDWVKGESLEAHVAKHVDDSEAINRLADRFSDMVATLRHMEIAHGDLQHGNIIVFEDQLRLVDYDGMFVPALAGMQSNEIGHPNYQHPGRNKFQFDSTLDYFSSWVIHDSLRLLALDANLGKRVKAFEECLLFRHADYANPSSSLAFALIEQHENEAVRKLGRRLRSLCSLAPNAVPALGDEANLSEPPEIPAAEIIEASFHKESFAPETALSGYSKAAVVDPLHPARVNPNWPTEQEYVNAAHLPPECFDDPELVDCKAVYNAHGLRREQGADGIVFCVQPNHKGQKPFAVKCFLHADPSRDERYEKVSAFLPAFPWHFYDHLIKVQYIKKGIRIGDVWYPVLKMPWLDGETLDKFVRNARPNKHLFLALLNQWRELLQSMKSAGIAHGDLCPANVLVCDGRLKLVDYDSFFVPSFQDARYKPLVTFDPDLRHPHASEELSSKMDNFPAWLIDTALFAMAYDPGIWDHIYNPRGRFLFQKSDMTMPHQSKLLGVLYHNENFRPLSNRARQIFTFLHMDPKHIPFLTTENISEYNKHLTPAVVARTRQQSKLATAAVISGVAVIAVVAFGPIIGPTAWAVAMLACIWTIIDLVRSALDVDAADRQARKP